MESLTKNKQSRNTIAQMVRKFFAPLEMIGCQELTEGYFNVAYEIWLSDGTKIILKVAPNKTTQIMTYEKNIMYSEVQAMKAASRVAGIPVPKVFGYDDSGTICPSPYFFMEKLHGQSLNVIKDKLNQKQIDFIYIQTGEVLRRVNQISNLCFGYPGQPEYQGQEWYPVFTKMLKAGLSDAEQGKVDLKIPVDRLLSILESDREIFEDVTQPRLVHWDCWDGNIFVEDGCLTGIIDWERCLWADPLLEVGFRTYAPNPAFQKGYGLEHLSKQQQRRALWYDIYLMVLVALECEYRQYGRMDAYEWSTGLLVQQFGKLNLYR